MTNVLSFNQAISQKFNPREYTYDIDSIPIGILKVKLDFKIYTKNAVGVTCYFSLELTEVKFALTVFRLKSGKREYKLPNSNIDFKTCATDQLYEIDVVKNSKGNIKIENAKLI